MIVKLTVSYDGTNYCGWQVQPNGVTIQEKIEYALKQVTGQDITVTGSGRTDAGVHALGQVVSFFVEKENIPAEKYASAINVYLPQDICVTKSEREKDGFNARFSAKKKTYRYQMYKSETVLPLKDRFAVKIPTKTDIGLMRLGAEYIVGEHDFKCFLKSNSSVKNTVRKIYSLKVKEDKDFVTITITGNGFLYNMVRIIAGTLLEVGQNRIEPQKIKEIIEGGYRGVAGKTLPAKGLTLMEVKY